MTARKVVTLWGYAAPFVVREVQAGIDDVLRGSGLFETRCHVSANDLTGGGALASLLDGEPAGAVGAALVLFVEIGEALAAGLERRGIPLVFGGSQQTAHARGSVVHDHADGARRAGAALAAIGRRRVAYVGVPPANGPLWAARHDGVAGGAKAGGAAFDHEPADRYEADEGAAAARRLLERAPGTDAIVCSSDLVALGVLRALRELRLDVPRDVALIGFDDTETGQAAGLSSVRQDFRRLGAEAARMALRAAAGDAGDLGRLVLPVELRLRASVLPESPDADLPPAEVRDGGWFVRTPEGDAGPFTRRSLGGWLRSETLVVHEIVASHGAVARAVPALREALAALRPPLEWWRVRRPGGEARGPITRRALLAMIEAGEVRPEDEVRHDSWPDFRPVRETRLAERLRPDAADLETLPVEEIGRRPHRRTAAAAGRPLPPWARWAGLAAAAALIALGLSWGQRRAAGSETALYLTYGRPVGDCASGDAASRALCGKRTALCGCAEKGSCGMASCEMYATLKRRGVAKD